MKHGKDLAVRAAIILLLILVCLTGCTYRNIKTEHSAPPSEKYSVVALGDVGMYDQLWDPLTPHFRRGFVKQLNEQKVFESVYDPIPESMSNPCIIVSGNITEVTKGNAALRFLIGFGAGSQRVKGKFQIGDNKGAILAKFEADESYAGGAGIGGAGFLDMEDLMGRFGETIAKKTVQWSRGESLNE